MQPRASRSAAALLPALVCAQVAGLLLADRGQAPALLLFPLALLALGLGACVRPRLRTALVLLAVLGASGGTLALRLERAAHARPPEPEVRTIEGRVTARDLRPGWIRLDLDAVVAADGLGDVPEGVRLQGRDSEALVALAPGERLRARVTLEAPAGARNPGARDAARALARAGIGAFARPVDPLLVVRRVEAGSAAVVAPRTGLIDRLRARAGQRLARDGGGGALLRALACGERAGLPESTRLAFQELGLSHLLSVSGLHLVLVAGLAHGAAVRLLRRLPRLAAARDVRRLALPLAFAVSVFYALFSGFEVPVQRSLVLVAGATLALARRRPLRARSALAAAAFLVLAARPAALFDAGAQMSFAASAALLSLRRDAAPGTAETRGECLRRALHELLATSAAATCATAPIAATHIGVIAPAGLVANLLFVPWTGVMLLPAALLAAALAAAPGEGALRDVLLALCAQVGDLTCAAVEHLAAWVPDLPPSGAPGPLLLLACAALAIGAARAHGLWARLACAALSCLALSLSPLDELSPAPPRAVFFDVGQGDATLVQGRNGAVLVDAGLALPDGMDLGRSVVLPGLAALGVRHLDVVIVTHGDADHRGGIPAVLRGVPVGALWLPVGAAAEREFHGILEAARARRVPVREVAAGDPPARVGDLTLTPLWPPRGVALASRNDRSLVVRVDAGGAAVLLPGDIEAGAEEALVAAGADLRSDVLKLAHHGSRTSTTPAFLGAVRPRLAIASAPCVGRFGMPHPEVVQRLEALPIAWGWTGREGALLVALGPAPEAHAFAAAPLRCAPGRRRDTSPRASWAERPRSRGVPRRRGPGRPVEHAKHCDVVRQMDHRVRPGLRTRRSALDTVM